MPVALYGVVGALLAAGLGAPLPEDVSLLGAGYLVHRGDVAFWVAFVACWVAILAGDATLFALGRVFGPRITSHRWLRHRLTAGRLHRLERHFAQHAATVLVGARFAAGARALFFVAAGALKVPAWKFAVCDGGAALVSGAAWIAIGWRFGGHLERVKALVGQAQRWLIVALLAVAIAWWVARVTRRRLAGPPAEAEPEQA